MTIYVDKITKDFNNENYSVPNVKGNVLDVKKFKNLVCISRDIITVKQVGI